MRSKQLGLGLDLRPWHATYQMGVHVLWLRRRRVVSIAANVEVVVVVSEFITGNDGRVRWHIDERLERGDDLLDVLRTEVVLRATGLVLAVGIDEDHPPLTLTRLCSLRA